ADHASRGAAPNAVNAPDRKPSAGATSVKGRPSSKYALSVVDRRVPSAGEGNVNDLVLGRRAGPERSRRTCQASASTDTAAAAVLMKFSMSLLTNPAGSSVAASALSIRAPAVAATTIASTSPDGTRPSTTPIAASARAPTTPAAVPSSD